MEVEDDGAEIAPRDTTGRTPSHGDPASTQA